MDRIMLWLDENVFLRSAGRKLCALFIFVLLMTVLVFFGVSVVHGFDWAILSEMLATQVGAYDLQPRTDAAFWGRFLFHLFCVLTFGGLLVSVFCSAVQRHEERVQAGLVRYQALKGHYVVVGWSALAPELVSRLLAGEMDGWHPTGEGRPRRTRRKPRLLLCTVSDVGTVRRELEERLGKKEFRRVVFYYGGLDFDRPEEQGERRQAKRQRIERVLKELGIAHSRQVFLLSDQADPWGRDVKILAFARMVADKVRLVPAAERESLGLSRTLPVFAEHDARGSQDIVPKFPSSPVGEPEKEDFSFSSVYFRPFSVYELWATRLFSPDLPAEIRPLLYRPVKSGDFVHLVIVGFTRMGDALAVQALRSCHFPAPRSDDPRSIVRTRITVIDRLPQEAVFRARYPHLAQIHDIDVEFVVGDVADPKIRETIRKSAVNPHCLLTVAVCLEDSDSSLAIALNLPEEVYQWGRSKQIGKDGAEIDAPPHRSRWKPNGNNVWVRQDFSSGFADALGNDDTRFAWVGAFGSVSDVLTSRSFVEHGAIIRRSVYDLYQKAVKRTAKERKSFPETSVRAGCLKPEEDPNLKTIAQIVGEFLSDSDRSRNFLKEAFQEFLDEFWTYRWANVHAADSVVAFLASLGLRAIPDEKGPRGVRERLENNVRFMPVLWDKFDEVARKAGLSGDAFAEAEHRRWMADRTLAGVRQKKKGECRDDEFLIHESFRPFADIVTQNNDRNSVLAIPLCLALEGFRLESCSKAPKLTVGLLREAHG